MPTFVQLLHPGKEPGASHGNIKEWNRGEHRRKFVRNPGSCLTDNGFKNGELLFWCEWEPESVVTDIADNTIIHGPQYLHIPFYLRHDFNEGLQRTDPFVFGDRFHYVICRQYKNNRPTRLRFLDRGSVILFGSCLAGSFILDTVFVVDKWIEFDRENAASVLNGKVSKTYWDTVIEPLLISKKGICSGGDEFRLYYGATYENSIRGMFSFSPCLLAGNIRGFARPAIKLDNAITDRITQGYKLTDLNDIHKRQLSWIERRLVC